jgi:uncharacterized membrane protein
MISHPGVMSMLFVAFLYAVAINFDKMVVQNSDAAFGSGIVFFVLGSAFLLIGILTRYPKASSPLQPLQEGMGGRDNPPMGWRWPDIAGAGLFIGIVITIEAVVINTAYMMQIVPYVIAIKRMSILLIVLYGALVFREKEILRRLSGTALMVLGAVMILLFP